MRPNNLFQLEMALVFKNKRALFIRIVFTLFLGLPFIMIKMPIDVKIAGLLFILIFIGFFGSAVTFVRRRSEGHFTKLKLLPTSLSVILIDFILAGVIMDCMQIGLLILLYLIIYGAGISSIIILKITGLMLGTLFLFSALGMLLAFTMNNNSEVHLFGAFASGVIAFISGLFPVPTGVENLIKQVEIINPLSHFGMLLMELSSETQSINKGFPIFEILFILIFIAAISLRITNSRIRYIKNPYKAG